ncbi:MAG: hypothetical protein OEZ38_13830, partial [Gammaproteobacteria bacterium]|nr:hypothetical protein [Gammaproteobacteria bacterium]
MTGNSLGCIVTSNATVSSDNNIFNDFCTFSIDGELSILQYSQWSSIYDITSITSSNANLFVNSALQDYSLLPTSPGVNFGINSYSGYSAPQTDINGTGRPVSGAIDVGAYENH